MRKPLNVPDRYISIRNYKLPRINPETNKYERHLPFANYIGPNTDIERRLDESIYPTTKTDRQAMHHDVDYFNIRSGLRKKIISKPLAAQLANQSDNRLISAARSNLRTLNPINATHAALTLSGMKTKQIAENIGAIDRLKFVGEGIPAKDPCKKMRQMMLKK